MPTVEQALDNLPGTRRWVDLDMADNQFSPDSQNLKCADPQLSLFSFPCHFYLVPLHLFQPPPDTSSNILLGFLCDPLAQEDVITLLKGSELFIISTYCYFPILEKILLLLLFLENTTRFFFPICSNTPPKSHQNSLSPLPPFSLNPSGAGF